MCPTAQSSVTAGNWATPSFGRIRDSNVMKSEKNIAINTFPVVMRLKTYFAHPFLAPWMVFFSRLFPDSVHGGKWWHMPDQQPGFVFCIKVYSAGHTRLCLSSRRHRTSFHNWQIFLSGHRAATHMTDCRAWYTEFESTVWFVFTSLQ